MEQRSACLAQIIEDADPAAQVPPAVAHQVARRLGRDVGQYLPLFGAETVLEQLLPLHKSCPECSASLSRCDSNKSAAVLLHTTGPVSKEYNPLRCRRKICPSYGKVVWHNYRVEAGKHIFIGNPPQLKCFTLTSSFSFSVEWLEQFHRRLVRQHASFISESDVAREQAEAHGQEHLLPGARLRLLISEGCFKWRLLLRLQSCGLLSAPHASLDLRQTVEELLGPAAEFTKSSVGRAREAGMRCDVLVMDGNAKNRRAVCASLLAGSTRSLSLARTLRHACPCTPVLGKKCHRHLTDETANVSQDRVLHRCCYAGLLLVWQLSASLPARWIMQPPARACRLAVSLRDAHSGTLQALCVQLG